MTAGLPRCGFAARSAAQDRRFGSITSDARDVSPRPALLGGRPAFPEKLPLARPLIEDVGGLAAHLAEILASGVLTNGPTVRALEEAVARRLGVDHVVAVANATAGLMLVYQALEATGRVVLPSFTFAASAHAVVWAGGRPVFADVDPARLSLDPADAATLLDGASALSATHLYGAPAQVEQLAGVAEAAGVPLVFDAAHALGSRRAGTPVGGFGTAEVFSLSPTKVAFAGEGGLVTTSRADVAEAVRLGRDYGNPGDYDCAFPGLNARMSELHAAVGLASLRWLDERIARRAELVAAFRAGLAGLPGLSYPALDPGDTTTYKDLTVLVEPGAFGLSAAELAVVLKAEGIDTRRYYAPPIHRQKAYAAGAGQRELPNTERAAERVLTVPLSSHLPERAMRAVADAILRAAEHAAALKRAL
jgi:dTDP-4-amino-4,6-dideoxygalactose transaminase